MAKRAIGIVKNILRKILDVNKVFMEYCNTSVSGLSLSSAQLLFSKNWKQNCLFCNKLLKMRVNKPYSKFCEQQARILKEIQNEKH